MASQTPNLTVSYQSTWKDCCYTKEKWQVTYQNGGNDIIVTSTLLSMRRNWEMSQRTQGLPYRLGMDAREVIGENLMHQLRRINIIQDLNFMLATLRIGNGVDKTIPKPAELRFLAEFVALCAHADPTTDNVATLDCGKNARYGKLT